MFIIGALARGRTQQLYYMIFRNIKCDPKRRSLLFIKFNNFFSLILRYNSLLHIVSSTTMDYHPPPVNTNVPQTEMILQKTINNNRKHTRPLSQILSMSTRIKGSTFKLLFDIRAVATTIFQTPLVDDTIFPATTKKSEHEKCSKQHRHPESFIYAKHVEGS